MNQEVQGLSPWVVQILYSGSSYTLTLLSAMNSLFLKSRYGSSLNQLSTHWECLMWILTLIIDSTFSQSSFSHIFIHLPFQSSLFNMPIVSVFCNWTQPWHCINLANIAAILTTAFTAATAAVLIGHLFGGNVARIWPYRTISGPRSSDPVLPLLLLSPVHIVAFSAIGLAWMGNHKAALVSKAGATVVLVRSSGGRELLFPVHNTQSQFHGPVPNPSRMTYAWIRPVGWVGSVFPSQA